MSLLRARRVKSALEESGAIESEKADRVKAEPPLPLELDPDRFWIGSIDLADFRVSITVPAIDAAPIKRLGVPKFWHGKQDFTALLTGAYQAITEASLEAGEAPEK
jgi:uncharacterized Zn finger protein